MSESDKTTITTATTSTAVTTASSDNMSTPSESYTSSQEGVLKLRLFKNTNTLIDIMPITRKKKKRQIPMKKWVIGVFFTFKRQFVMKLEKIGQRQNTH